LSHHELGCEVTSFYFNNIEVEIEDRETLQRFTRHAHKFKMFNLLDYIRKLYIPFVNGSDSEMYIYSENSDTRKPSKYQLDESNQRANKAIKAYYSLIASCKHLRELELILSDRYHVHHAKNGPEYCLGYAKALMTTDKEFDIQSVLACKGLRKVCITGIAQDMFLFQGNKELVGLRGTRDIGRSIREGFKIRGQDTNVRVLLHYCSENINLQNGEEDGSQD
jgi:hypothetical protein